MSKGKKEGFEDRGRKGKEIHLSDEEVTISFAQAEKEFPKEGNAFHNSALLHLSGSKLQVGALIEREGVAVFIYPDDCSEPIYMSANEARMLVATLNVAIEECDGDV